MQELFIATIASLTLIYASTNYGVVLSTYAEYWSSRSPYEALDERYLKPAIILSASLTPSGAFVKLMRTYAEPGLLELTVTAKLFTSEGGVVFLTARMRAPVGTIQEFVFQGGLQEPFECAELVVIMNGEGVDRWSGCIQG